MKKNPFFTIIIPTRNGSTTIIPTLQTVLNQNFRNFEVIISVNHKEKTNKTISILKKIKDKRVRIFNTNKDLSMSENWEYALEKKIRGKYITFIGDDDAFTINAFEKASSLIKKYKIKILTWGLSGEYFWPNTGNYDANFLYLKSSGELILQKSSEIVKKVLNYNCSYTDLPMLYNSFIEKKIISNFKKKNKKFFLSRTPDVFSGFVIASSSEFFYRYNYPLQIAGVSKKSNGNAFFHKKKKFVAASRDFRKLKNIQFENNLVYAPSFPILTMESFLKAKNKIDNFKNFKIDLRRMMYEAFNETRNHPNRVKIEVIRALKIIGDLNNLKDWYKFLKAKKFRNIITPKPIERISNIKKHYIINLNKKDIKNVFDMCKYIEKRKILSSKQSIFYYFFYQMVYYFKTILKEYFYKYFLLKFYFEK